MISYNWDVQPAVKELRKRLGDAGLKVWIDVEQMAQRELLYLLFTLFF